MEPNDSPRRVCIERLMLVASRLRDEGCQFDGEASEIASQAYRRWQTFRRRHEKVKIPTHEDRTRDLFKGLSPKDDPDWLHTHPEEIQHLSEQLSEVLMKCE